MTKEYIIYSKWLADKLHNQGFRLIRTEENKKDNKLICWVFENNLDLQLAIAYLTKRRKKKGGSALWILTQTKRQ